MESISSLVHRTSKRSMKQASKSKGAASASAASTSAASTSAASTSAASTSAASTTASTTVGCINRSLQFSRLDLDNGNIAFFHFSLFKHLIDGWVWKYPIVFSVVTAIVDTVLHRFRELQKESSKEKMEGSGLGDGVTNNLVHIVASQVGGVGGVEDNDGVEQLFKWKAKTSSNWIVKEAASGYMDRSLDEDETMTKFLLISYLEGSTGGSATGWVLYSLSKYNLSSGTTD
ncbi:UNVERIFIED_CONTAM: hypothetical protein HDU68_011301 [Siphonaria sp. JEL0065]|nr:hypothetical protein HDU68_011301 [Siphonaria sp. JEL0065]